jgi:hypothetical protein
VTCCYGLDVIVWAAGSMWYGLNVMIWNSGLNVMWTACDGKNRRTICDVDQMRQYGLNVMCYYGLDVI